MVRAYAVILACTCHDRAASKAALATIHPSRADDTARMSTRRKRPNTYQLLLALTTQDAPDDAF